MPKLHEAVSDKDNQISPLDIWFYKSDLVAGNQINKFGNH